MTEEATFFPSTRRLLQYARNDDEETVAGFWLSPEWMGRDIRFA
jgi:hypothetical protein